MAGRLSSALGRFRHVRPPSEVVLTRKASGSAAYAATGQATWTLVEPAAHVERRAPVHFGTEASRLDEHLVTDFPDLGVLSVPGGIVAGEYGWVVGPDGTLLHDHSWHGDAPEQRRMYTRRTGDTFPVEHLGGTVVSLATFAGWRNYGHFLLDGASRLRLVEDAGFAIADADHVLYNAPHAGARRILERLGVPMDRAIPVRNDVAFQADTLIAPTFPGLRRNYQPWVPRWLRSRLVTTTPARTRRLYVPRMKERLVLNLDELQPLLDAHGFETFDPTAHADPLLAFAEASVVVGAHGAGITDIAFCQPGSAVLELLPSAHQMPYYYTLADGADLAYGFLVGPSRPDLAPTDRPSKVSFTLDAGEFRDALEATIAAAPATPPATPDA
ncbi:MAG: glycosyltransferase family 61 protein [Chloroflexota bacterium]